MPNFSSLPLHRTTIQVKTHAQVELKKLDDGINIFEELDGYQAGESPQENDDLKTLSAENTENLHAILDDDAVVVDETPKKTSSKKTPKKKTSTKKKKSPKEKPEKVQVGPQFVLSPRSSAVQNTKTPVMSKKMKSPKAKPYKVQVDPQFVLSPRSAAVHNAKTPVMSNKSNVRSSTARRPSSVSFSTSSSMTNTVPTYRESLPYQPITGSAGFHPLAMTGTLPPSFFHFPLPIPQ